jgi:hypothetical protein
MCALTVIFAIGCAAPGAPEPPSLELARPVRNLRATRKGNEVHLTWSVPVETTDHHAFRRVGATQVCRSLGSPSRECTRVAEVPTPRVETTRATRFHSENRSPTQQAPTAEASYTDQLSPDFMTQSPTSNLVYAVNVLNSYDRSAGLSNEIQVPSAPTISPPGNFRADLTQDGVKLAWSPVVASQDLAGLQYQYRVYRRDVQSGKDSVAGELPISGKANPTLLDTGFDWERTYEYRLTVVTLVEQGNGTEQVEGDDTAPVRVVTHDVFPPATPTGLQAVFSGPGRKPFIDLVWKANAESDLAGYNVYRHEAGQPSVKINSEIVKEPAYRDVYVMSGYEYFYSISAVDVRGNESPRSTDVSEHIPMNQ